MSKTTLYVILFTISPFIMANIPTVGTWKIPFYLESENKGPFIAMLKKIGEMSKQDFTVELYPPKRSIEYFKDNKIEVLFPATNPNIPKIDIIKSVPFMQKRVFAFVMKGKKLPVSIKDLEGKTVGIVRGYSYPKTLIENENIRIEISKSAETSQKKLKSGRVDIVLNDINVGKNAIIYTKNKNAIYNEKKPFAIIDVYFAFQNTKQGKDLEMKVSKAITKMKKDKSIFQYFKRPKNK